ncbi:DUF6074 family protein [Rhizobium sp. YJ-22]|uniref:DUF6074 family protein n=1 Tax=Rhizobium sp. YJ-22 TaxID=3037556 RepID=UPI002412973E|nr:DUF6074 family protein [Rhizobium sp. YJ-22]MDG3577148.1 DUF6074 family protein [Rhizobium sp. YJ-22]
MTDTCQMIPFPLNRRVGKVRRVAEVLMRRAGKEQQAYWKTELNRLCAGLADLGFAEPEIHSQLRSFRAAVEFEIRRQSISASPAGNNPKGAA